MTKYYYVKYNGQWTVAKVSDDYNRLLRYTAFWLCGENSPFVTSHFDEIGDEILMPVN